MTIVDDLESLVWDGCAVGGLNVNVIGDGLEVLRPDGVGLGEELQAAEDCLEEEGDIMESRHKIVFRKEEIKNVR